jgi:hypothetical protein
MPLPIRVRRLFEPLAVGFPLFVIICGALFLAIRLTFLILSKYQG